MIRLSTIPGADERDAILLEREDGALFLTARVDGAHTSVEMDVAAVDRLIRDLQRWRYFEGTERRYHRWEDRATPHFQIDEDGKVTQLLPIQRSVNDMVRRLHPVVESGAWPLHVTEKVRHHSYDPGNNHRQPYSAVVRTPEEREVAEAFGEALRKALLIREVPRREAIVKLCRDVGFEPTDWQIRYLEEFYDDNPHLDAGPLGF